MSTLGTYISYFTSYSSTVDYRQPYTQSMTLIEPPETYESYEMSEFGRIDKTHMRLLEVSQMPLQHEDRSERFVDANTKNGKTSMQDMLYTILSKGEHKHFMASGDTFQV